MKKAEIVLITLGVISLIMKCFFFSLADAICVFSFLSLAILYLVGGVSLFMNIPFRKSFKIKKQNLEKEMQLPFILSIVTGICLFIPLIGLLFFFQHWPGHLILTTAGIFPLLNLSLFCIFKYDRTKIDSYFQISKRTVIVGGIGLLILFSPFDTWYKIHYRNYPSYLKALESSRRYPRNRNRNNKAYNFNSHKRMELDVKLDYEYDKIHRPEYVENMKKMMNKRNYSTSTKSGERTYNELYFQCIKEDSITHGEIIY